MSDLAIRVQGLSKQYRLGAAAQGMFRYQSLRDTLGNLGARLLRRDAVQNERQGSFWALKDVSFDVRQGEVVGIIGRNGAGKSTLLKILSRITDPTEGSIDLYGRVGSLLEVGTGFHPELTGRENIFLNGAILGMRREEIRRKFDEIVAFAEVEQFIDTAVKHYSSGMYMRLAFSVAAHLEPEILVVDEVLAVGDAQFQKKCLGKMGEVAQGGRTVLFVSHNMAAIRNLCTTAILLHEGRVSAHAAVEMVTQLYLEQGHHQDINVAIPPEWHRSYPPDLEIYQVNLINASGSQTSSLLIGEEFTLQLPYRIHQHDQSYRIGFILRAGDGTTIGTSVQTDRGMAPLPGKHERGIIEATMRNILLPGMYTLDITVKNSFGTLVDWIEGVRFSVEPMTIDGSLMIYRNTGIVVIDADWHVIRLDESVQHMVHI